MPSQRLWPTGNVFESYADIVSGFEVQQGLVVTQKPEGIPRERQAMRHTVGLILMDHDVRHLRFAFHKQRNIPNKPPEYYRLEIVGGGVPTHQQRVLEAVAATQELLVDPELFSNGTVPANFDFLYLGKGFLRSGRFPDLTPEMTPETLEQVLRAGLAMRIGDELGGRAMGVIDRPAILNTGRPRDTHLASANFGRYTEQIAQKFGLEIDAKTNRLLGIVLTIREYFALATTDIDRLQDRAGDRMEVHTLDSLEDLIRRNVFNAENQSDLSVWKNRGPGGLRNSSLLAGVGAALKQADSSLMGRAKRGLLSIRRWLTRRNWAA